MATLKSVILEAKMDWILKKRITDCENELLRLKKGTILRITNLKVGTFQQSMRLLPSDCMVVLVQEQCREHFEKTFVDSICRVDWEGYSNKWSNPCFRVKIVKIDKKSENKKIYVVDLNDKNAPSKAETMIDFSPDDSLMTNLFKVNDTLMILNPKLDSLDKWKKDRRMTYGESTIFYLIPYNVENTVKDLSECRTQLNSINDKTKKVSLFVRCKQMYPNVSLKVFYMKLKLKLTTSSFSKHGERRHGMRISDGTEGNIKYDVTVIDKALKNCLDAQSGQYFFLHEAIFLKKVKQVVQLQISRKVINGKLKSSTFFLCG